MSNQVQNPNKNNKYDLQLRTSTFAHSIIRFAKTLPETTINKPIIVQLVRAATSIGANYMEADGAVSKKDFFHKIGLCKKESKESMYWIHIIGEANSNRKVECRTHYQEAKELALIFSAIGLKK